MIFKKHVLNIFRTPNQKISRLKKLRLDKNERISDFDKSFIKELKKTEHFIMPITIENFQDFYVNKDINGYKQFFENNYLGEN